MERDTIQDIREKIEEKVSCLILSGLIVELLILVIMVVFEFDKKDNIDFFYLFSVIYLMLGTIYFAWASVVKENAFELISFMIISTLLTTHAILEDLIGGPLSVLHLVSLIIYVSVQVLYYICFYFAYTRFSWRTASEINAVNPKIIQIFKLYQHFVSLVKLDLVLYCIVSFIYLFAIFVDWNFFHVGGIVLGTCSLALIMIYAGLGICFMKRESKKGIWAFWVLRIVGEGVKGLMVFQVIYGTEPLRVRLIFIEMNVVASFSFCLFLYIFGVSCSVFRKFGCGLRQVIYKRIEASKRPFI